MSSDGPIRGVVARVLNTREVVINRGKQNGVERGMVFAILNADADDVVDPETGECLGPVERTKVLVKIVEVEEKLSIAKTFRFRYTGGAYSSLTAVSILFEPRRKVYDSLELDDNTAVEIDEEDSYVKVGDPVKQSAYEE